MEQIDVSKKWSELIKGGFFDTYTYEARRRYLKALSRLTVPKDAYVLEVGCGTGRYHRVLKEAGFRNVVSGDITWEHITGARENNPDGRFIVASGEGLPFEDDAFDAVVSNAAIEHFPHPDTGIREISRVLRPGGTAVITSDCYIWRIFQILGLYRSRMPIDRAMTIWKFKDMFSKAGLVLDDYEGWGVTHYLRSVVRLMPACKTIRESAEDDSHWSNTRVSSHALNWLRTFMMDENLFVVRKPGVPSAFKRKDISADMLGLIACPACHAVLESQKDDSILFCGSCRRTFPVREGIPVLLHDASK